MVDERIRKTAELLVDYSTEIKNGDKVVISFDYPAKDLALEVYKLVLERGAIPRIDVSVSGFAYYYFKLAKEHQLKYFPEEEMVKAKNYDVFINIRAPENVKELMGVDARKIGVVSKVRKPIRDEIIQKKRWVLFYYPTNALAQEAGMPYVEFYDFVFNATLVDWRSMSSKLQKIKEVLDRTDKVRIEGDKTDLEFSVKGRNAVVADGKKNMPDGEVFTSVVEDSVNGEIYYEFPAIWMGNEVEGIHLTFEGGKVIDAKAERNEEFLLSILEIDEGAKRLGEFGIGLNYNIDRFVKNILFDEKIGGTIHLALGQSYEETLGKNVSAIHWDMIKDLRTRGRIYFDGELVFENGKWLFLE